VEIESNINIVFTGSAQDIHIAESLVAEEMREMKELKGLEVGSS